MATKTLISAVFAGIGAFSALSAGPETSVAPQDVKVPLAIVHGTALAPILTPETTAYTPLPAFLIPSKRLAQRRVIVTAYSSTPDQTDSTPFTTASGTEVREGVVAANWLPIGAYVRLPEIYGERILVVEDRMHPKNGHKLDVWMPTREAAKQFGVKRLLVEILPL
jgi:3D (Asp-Asp-Asp) domain-containing protein